MHKEALSRGMASAWTASAVGIALVALGNLAESRRFLERAKATGQLDPEASSEFSPVRWFVV